MTHAKMYNILQMNNWEIRKFLTFALTIQMVLWGSIGLEAVGLGIPILRQLVGFIYLVFIPGITILRVIKLHRLGNIETLLYTVGLSIATLMFIGLFINILYPFLGVSKPISLLPLITTISFVEIILCMLCYVRNRDFYADRFVNLGNLLSPSILLLCLIPILSILSIRIMYSYRDNRLVMILIAVIALIVILIGFDKFIPPELYPFTIFVIALSLLLNQSLIGNYVYGYDNCLEYYISEWVKTNSIWDSTIYSKLSISEPSNYNSMLSVVMLAPIYSIVLNLDINWILKLVYPSLYSLVLLGLFLVFQKLTNAKIAFLSCFFFISQNTFYETLPYLSRQEIGELFLILLIMLIVDGDIIKTKRVFLSTVFSFSLVVSHYALSYIYMIYLAASLPLSALLKNQSIQKWTNRIWFNPLVYNFISIKQKSFSEYTANGSITKTSVTLFISLSLAWYIFIADSSLLATVVDSGGHIIKSIQTDFLNPEAAEGLTLMIMAKESGLFHRINQITNYSNQVFIIIGCIILFFEHNSLKIKKEYLSFIIMSQVICIMGVTVPFFASQINMNRLYHIMLIFLAPTCVIGGLAVLIRIFPKAWGGNGGKSCLNILFLYFVVFFLLQSSFVWELTEGQSASRSLNESSEWSYFTDQEIIGAKWLKGITSNTSTDIYTDDLGYRLLFSQIDISRLATFSVNSIDQIPEGSYAFFGTLNIIENEARILHTSSVSDALNNIELVNTALIVNGKKKIYSNGGSDIFIV